MNDGDGVALGLDEIDEVGGFEKNCGGVVVGVDADEFWRAKKIFVEIEFDLVSFIIEQTERGNGARGETHEVEKIGLGSKAEIARVVGFAKILKVDALVALDSNKIIGGFFVVAHEKVFGVSFGIGKLDFGKFGHIINRGMFDNFVPEMM